MEHRNASGISLKIKTKSKTSYSLRLPRVICVVLMIIMGLASCFLLPSAYLNLVNGIKDFFGFEFTEGAEAILMGELQSKTIIFTYAAILVLFLITLCTYMKFVSEWRLFMPFNFIVLLANVPPMLIFLVFLIYTLFATKAAYFFFVGMAFSILFIVWDLILLWGFTVRETELSEINRKRDSECPILKNKTKAISKHFVALAKKALRMDVIVLIVYVCAAGTALLLQGELKPSDIFKLATISILYFQSIVCLICYPEVIAFWDQNRIQNLEVEVH